MLLIGAVGFLVWSIVLVLTPGGSKPIEFTQLILSVTTGLYAAYSLQKNDPVHTKRCRYLVLAFGIIGIAMVLGLASDQRSSRTWARLGWAAAVFGYTGSIVVWFGDTRTRMATISLALVGAVLLVAAVGLTLNCDPGIQRSWCDPVFEREQVLAEQIEVDGELEQIGRAGASLGAAYVSHFVMEGASIDSVTHPPGEWEFEPMPVQGIEKDRGIFTSSDSEYADCRLNAKIETVPAGNRHTVFVSCGLGT
ncbi:hypothetical protein BH23ACT4_BH23ACT4_01500 [soil metagenome]